MNISLFPSNIQNKRDLIVRCDKRINNDQKDFYDVCDFINHFFHLFPCHKIDKMVNNTAIILGLIRSPAPWLINKEK
jgi:hypothetical protein